MIIVPTTFLLHLLIWGSKIVTNVYIFLSFVLFVTIEKMIPSIVRSFGLKSYPSKVLRMCCIWGVVFHLSESNMETEKEKQRPPHSQLISVPPKDTVRLLEVYVKRSLSLNDGTHGLKVAGRKEKWVTVPKRQRHHSSDPSLHLAPSLENVDGKEIDTFSPVEHVPNQTEKCPEEPEKPTKKSKKIKKTSFWKNIVGFFTRKDNEDKDDEQDSPPDMSKSSETVTNCLPITPVTLPKKSTRKKSLRRRFSKRQQSLTKPNKPADITGVEGMSVGELTFNNQCYFLHFYSKPNHWNTKKYTFKNNQIFILQLLSV